MSTKGASTVTIQCERGSRFRSNGQTAFIVSYSLIVGKTKTGQPYAIPVLDVLREYLETAEPPEIELVKKLAEEKLRGVV